MSSLIENLKGRPKYAPAETADIQKRLADAETALADLEAKRDAASLAALTDAPGGRDALAKLSADVKAAQDNLAMLRSAYRGAVQRDADAILRLRKASLETAYRSVVASLALRDKAADLYAVAIAEANKQYRIMHASHLRAHEAWSGAQMELPRGAISASDLIRLAAGESWRHTDGRIGGDPLALPGAAASEAAFIGDPSRMAPLDTTLRQDSTWLKEQLTKKIPK